MDLVRQVAALAEETCEPEPENWYARKFGQSPDYSVLLEQLARTSSERTTVLASYFEPSPADRENGRKLPTKAHQQIAKLVAKGYIRVIITTNFDRLMEQALEKEGIVPTVISTVDAIKGAMPLQHAVCTVLKVHGDYRDTRFRNTEAELAAYPPELNQLLDRILDEYGVLVCGWSATWDHALRQAFLRSPNRRFTTAWAAKGQPSVLAQDLITFRHSTVIDISSADDFFSELGNKIDALERFHAPHPLSVELAIISTKRFLSKPEYRIDLMDLVAREVENQLAVLHEDPYLKAHRATTEEYGEALTRIEKNLDILLNIVATGIHFGPGQYPDLWSRLPIRMLDLVTMKGGTSLAQIRQYPASLLLYAEGVAACSAGDYRLLKSLFSIKASIEQGVSGKTPVIDYVIALRALEGDNLNKLTGQRFHVPASERMLTSLRGCFRATIPNDDDFEDLFDRFEYLLALYYLSGRINDSGYKWAPVGRFGYRKRHSGQHISKILDDERQRDGADWSPTAQGLFDDAGYQTTNAALLEFLKNVNF